MNIEQIYDINGAYNLFRYYNGLANNNCIFFASVNEQTSANVNIWGGALGAFVSGMENGAQHRDDYKGYIINQTEYGIGLIPLQAKGILRVVNNMSIVPNAYIFINQRDIKSVSIKNFMLINTKSKSVKIETHDGFKLDLIVNKKEKLLPYHEINFSNFMQFYNTK